jgi:Skp family chaperone for outer membrane proteins
MKMHALAFFLLALTVPARAIELSLEENRASKGSVGYVDMQRIFSESPDSERARVGFEAMVREAQEHVNLRKAELLKLRQELESVKSERERLSKQAVVAPAAALPAASSAPAAAIAVSTGAAAPRGLLPMATLMGMTPAPPLAAPPQVAVSTAAARPGAVAVSSAPAAASVAVTTAPVAAAPRTAPAAIVVTTAAVASAAAAPAVSAPAVSAPASSTSTAAALPPNLAQRALELDGKIIALQAEVLRRDEALSRERMQTDRGLVSIEGHRTDQVLTRIYRAITEVAHQEGLSIVVDKSSILYGHQGVDLTDKVLQFLRSSPP